MDHLFARKASALLVGQTAVDQGTFMHQTVKDIHPSKRLEFPVNESFQLQFSLGLALAGYLPVTMFPRQNFLLLAFADMVNMMDKLPDLSNGRVKPHMIIRTATGPDYPVHPGHQHIGNYLTAFSSAFKNTKVLYFDEPRKIALTYRYAMDHPGLYLLIEEGNYYNNEYVQKYGYE